MQGRLCLRALLLVSLVLPFVGCGSSTGIDSITISPAAVSLGTGSTAQLTAIGSISHGSHPASTENITASVTWASSATSVATISSAGVVTGVGAGTTTITASTQGFGGTIVSNQAAITVLGSGGGGTKGSTLASLAIIPGSQSVASPGQTTQFIAIGTTSTGATEDLNGQVAWDSSSTQVATINSSGLATGVSQGTSTITAIATNSDGTVVTGTATFTVAAGASEPFTAIAVNPGSESLSATGQTGQLIALGTSGTTGLNQDVTNSSRVTWTSSIPSIATVSTYPASSAGLATGVSPGETTITATLANPDGTVVTSSANITVSVTAAPEPLISLSIIPTSATVGNLLDTAQFIAIGTFSTNPTVQDLTNSPSLTWLSSAPDIFPINTTGAPGSPAGVVTAEGTGTVVIIAEAKNPDGSVATATATFSCPLVLPDPPLAAGSCYPGSESPSLLATLTIFNAGLNDSTWLVTAPSATGTADVLHCGPGSNAAGFGGSVCEASYPIGTTVTLTAPAGTGRFGGWSSNCTEVGVTAAGPNSCTVVLTTNDTVGGIFN